MYSWSRKSRRGEGTAMAMAVMAWIVAIPLLGAATGMRTFTPMAVICWFAYAGYVPVDGTWAFWVAKLVTAVIFTVLALGELVGDKLPRTPDRTSTGPLLARILFGGLVGGIVAASLNGSEFEGVILGVGGALVGAFGGHLIRREIVLRSGSKDWPVAVAEDLVTVGFAVMALGIVTG
ncbi:MULTISPECIES: DUF4126 family protein [Acidobacteriaceae]|uniref:DUF4126 family protein n=1 Tax=Acidobacteriaceae TaxID=204434 RepID=UPI00131C329A|nr:MULTISPECIES: DUF4126 family protein [Acidobacteriaceae]MDW5265720.1 DUF4126 family protein [Edaphobacter sp.]